MDSYRNDSSGKCDCIFKKICTKQLIQSENNDSIHFSYLAHAYFFFQASQANMHVTGEKKRQLARNN